jgi:hypothetical protein
VVDIEQDFDIRAVHLFHQPHRVFDDVDGVTGVVNLGVEDFQGVADLVLLAQFGQLAEGLRYFLNVISDCEESVPSHSGNSHLGAKTSLLNQVCMDSSFRYAPFRIT